MASFRPCKNQKCGHLIDPESPRKYCSEKCKQKAYRDRSKGKHFSSAVKTQKHCAYCGQVASMRPNQRTCCKAHKQALYRELKGLGQKHDYSL